MIRFIVIAKITLRYSRLHRLCHQVLPETTVNNINLSIVLSTSLGKCYNIAVLHQSDCMMVENLSILT